MGSGGTGASGGGSGNYGGSGYSGPGGTGYGGDTGGYGTAGEMSGGAGGAGMAGYGGGGLAGVAGSGWGGPGGSAGRQAGVIGQGSTFGTPALAPGYAYNQKTGTVYSTPAQALGYKDTAQATGVTSGGMVTQNGNLYRVSYDYRRGEPHQTLTLVGKAPTPQAKPGLPAASPVSGSPGMPGGVSPGGYAVNSGGFQSPSRPTSVGGGSIGYGGNLGSLGPGAGGTFSGNRATGGGLNPGGTVGRF